MLKCKYCEREAKSKNSNVQHEIRCRKNPKRIKVSYNFSNRKGKKGSNQYIKAREEGLPDPIVTEEVREKCRQAAIKQHATQWTPERRQQHSESMKRAVREKPDAYTKNNVSGRVKLIEYNGVKLKGSWELITAKWLDSMNIKWESEVNPQEYIWNNGTHLYFPDFYLTEYNVYIEVKGYKRERDEAKWNSFNDTLTIIDTKIIHKLELFNNIEEFIDKQTYKLL